MKFPKRELDLTLTYLQDGASLRDVAKKNRIKTLSGAYTWLCPRMRELYRLGIIKQTNE